MKVLFVGGKTLGPVMPLLAIVEYWKRKDPLLDVIWIGTKDGPEKKFVQQEGIRFFSITSVRLTRYVSKEWLLIPFSFCFSCLEAFLILVKEKPDLIASAGGFSAVPVSIIGWFLRIPIAIHQQDALPSLTNRLLCFFSSLFTAVWEKTKLDWIKYNIVVVGNFFRSSLCFGNKELFLQNDQLDKNKPTIFVMGGGGGSSFLNESIFETKNSILEFANIIHATGLRKEKVEIENQEFGYIQKEHFKEDLKDVYAICDLVITRAGMGSLTELVGLKKDMVIIPIPYSHQEQNAQLFKNFGLVLDQNKLDKTKFVEAIKKVLFEKRKIENSQNSVFPFRTNDFEKMIQLYIHTALAKKKRV